MDSWLVGVLSVALGVLVGVVAGRVIRPRVAPVELSNRPGPLLPVTRDVEIDLLRACVDAMKEVALSVTRPVDVPVDPMVDLSGEEWTSPEAHGDGRDWTIGAFGGEPPAAVLSFQPDLVGENMTWDDDKPGVA